jgi:uncharacterized SAM-dependent methyltransferase
VTPIEKSYLEGLREAAAQRCPGQRMLVLFLGSTIGNFEPEDAREFLCGIRAELSGGDGLLLGTDLEKSIPQLIQAYDDPLGVTAAFNLNLLVRINRELDADFDLKQFRHLARFNPETGSVEMHLQSLRKQTVMIHAADLEVAFEEGETIWTENSHKYTHDEIARLAETAGFQCEAQWIDHEWPFAESLFVVN